MLLLIQEAAKAKQVAEMEEAALMAHGKYSSVQVDCHSNGSLELFGSDL